MDATAVLTALRNPSIPFTSEQLKEASEHLRWRFDHAARVNARAFVPGQKVAFDDRNGFTQIGTVEKINQKTITVRAMSGVKWRVHSSLLRGA